MQLRPRKTHTQGLVVQVQWTSAPSVCPLVAAPQPHFGYSTIEEPEGGISCGFTQVGTLGKMVGALTDWIQISLPSPPHCFPSA